MAEMIQIIFERGEEPMIYRDALYLPVDHALSDAEIEAMKNERYLNWKTLIETASNTPASE